MPFISHLEELKSVIIKIIIALAVGFVLCYLAKERLFDILAEPLKAQLPQGSFIIFTNLPEAFFTYVKVSFFASILLTSPFTLYQIWTFLEPGLYSSEKRLVVPFVIFSTIFFAGGVFFAFSIVFPFGFQFFMTFTTDSIRPMLSMREFFSFSLKLLLAFGLIFELPVFMFFLAKVGLVKAAMLRTKRKYAIVLIFIAAAILTPPDVFTQLLMAGPLLALYEISVLVVAWAESKASVDDEDKAAS